MALKSVFPSADDIPEGLKDYYTEQKTGDKTVYVLDIEDVDNHPKVRGVITANTENKRKAQERQAKIEELEGKLSALPEDFDPDEWGRLKSGAKPDEALQALKDTHARAVEAMKAKHAQDLAAKDTALNERDGYIDSTTRKEALQAALDEAGFDPAHKALLIDHLGPKIKVRREEDGRRIAFADTDLGEIAPADFVKDFAAKQGKAYLAKASGPGANGSNNHKTGGKTITREQFDAMDASAKHQAIVTDKMQVVD